MKESASIKQIHLKDLRSMTFARAPVMKTREREWRVFPRTTDFSFQTSSSHLRYSLSGNISCTVMELSLRSARKIIAAWDDVTPMLFKRSAR